MRMECDVIRPRAHPFARRSLAAEVAVFAVACSACFLLRLGAVGLFDFDEGLYVQAAREIVIRGDVVTPSVNGVRFHDKPALAVWASALSIAAFGAGEAAARLPVALASCLLVVLVWWFCRPRIGRFAALVAAASLALNPLVLGTAR